MSAAENLFCEARRQWLSPDAITQAALFAVAPLPTVLSGPPGPARDQWLDWVRANLAAEAPWRKVPANVSAGRLAGGLDLAATLQTGRTVAEAGLLAEVDGGVLVLAMAERISPMAAGIIMAALDRGEVILERDGLSNRVASRFGIVALDEGIDDSENLPGVLSERMALHVDLDQPAEPSAAFPDAATLRRARTLLPQVTVDDEILAALNLAALQLGIGSMRPVMWATFVTRVIAALAGETQAGEEHAAAAARLVLAPRAEIAPAMEPADQPQPPEPPDSTADQSAADDPSAVDAENELSQLDDVIIEAAQAAIPDDLLKSLQATQRRNGRGQARFGSSYRSRRQGRPIGASRGDPSDGSRLHVIETLRAAAPWQPLRRQGQDSGAAGGRVQIRRSDFRIRRFKQRCQTVTIFAVDASGSAAANRLAEAKGAVELMLADCYVRRDQVAMIAFRQLSAELLLPPTSSLVRVKRSLARLPAGGGTPLAAGIDAATDLADNIRRSGDQPVVILMTDGRGNITRDGRGNPADAAEESLAAARRFRGAGASGILLDVSPRPRPFARTLADAMGARYLPLPFADAGAISSALRQVDS